jgi:hypothetical protein
LLIDQSCSILIAGSLSDTTPPPAKLDLAMTVLGD